MGHRNVVRRFRRFSGGPDDEGFLALGLASLDPLPPPRRAFSFAFCRSLRIRRSSFGSGGRGRKGLASRSESVCEKTYAARRRARAEETRGGLAIGTALARTSVSRLLPEGAAS